MRDLLSHIVPTDIDLATNATPTEMKKMFEEEKIRIFNLNGEKHGTICVRINDNVSRSEYLFLWAFSLASVRQRLFRATLSVQLFVLTSKQMDVMPRLNGRETGDSIQCGVTLQ